MGGTEKFRLGTGSQVACTPPVHLSYLFYLVARLSNRSTFRRSRFSSLRSLLFSIYLPLSISLFFGEEIDEGTGTASFTCVQTALTVTRVTVVSQLTHARHVVIQQAPCIVCLYTRYIDILISRTLLWFTDHLPAIWNHFVVAKISLNAILCRNF